MFTRSTAVTRLGSAAFHKKSGKKSGKNSGKKTERGQNFRGDLKLEVLFNGTYWALYLALVLTPARFTPGLYLLWNLGYFPLQNIIGQKPRQDIILSQS